MNQPNYYIPPRGFTIPIGDGFTIYYYAIMIVCGIILAAVVVGLLFKRRNIPVDWVLDLLLCVLPIGIVCARLFYCITGGVPIQHWLSMDETYGIRAGGLSIIGGVMGGTLGVVLFCVIHKINFLRVADCLVPGVILAQGIGRWGNFFNQEVYGAVVENTSLQWFPFAVFIEESNTWHYAFFFYESMLNLIVFALLFTLMWKFRKKPSGLSLAGYLFGYGIVRSIMEPLRAPQYILGDKVQISWVMAVIMASAGVVLAVCLLIWNYKKYGKLFGAADEAQALAVLPAYYTKEQRRAMEEAEKKKRAALRARRAAQQSPAAGASQSRASGGPAADGKPSGAALVEEEYVPQSPSADGVKKAAQGQASPQMQAAAQPNPAEEPPAEGSDARCRTGEQPCGQQGSANDGEHKPANGGEQKPAEKEEL